MRYFTTCLLSSLIGCAVASPAGFEPTESASGEKSDARSQGSAIDVQWVGLNEGSAGCTEDADRWLAAKAPCLWASAQAATDGSRLALQQISQQASSAAVDSEGRVARRREALALPAIFWPLTVFLFGNAVIHTYVAFQEATSQQPGPASASMSVATPIGHQPAINIDDVQAASNALALVRKRFRSLPDTCSALSDGQKNGTLPLNEIAASPVYTTLAGSGLAPAYLGPVFFCIDDGSLVLQTRRIVAPVNGDGCDGSPMLGFFHHLRSDTTFNPVVLVYEEDGAVHFTDDRDEYESTPNNSPFLTLPFTVMPSEPFRFEFMVPLPFASPLLDWVEFEARPTNGPTVVPLCRR